LHIPGSENEESIRSRTKREHLNHFRLTIKHHRTGLLRHTHITGFLLELTHSTLLHSLTGIDKARRDLNDNPIDWGPILLLQQQFRPRGLVENRADPYTINRAVGRAGLR
jgi:hypothetical protein